MHSKYGFGKEVNLSFDKAVERVTQALQKEGFGVLTDIDVAATLKQKLDHDMPPYRILGACNPPLAQRALSAEPSIGLLLPCNVVVRQDQAGAVQVEIMDPNAVLDLVEKPAIAELAREARRRLERALAALGNESPAAEPTDRERSAGARFKLVTTQTCHCSSIEQELNDLGLGYERLYAEDQPELVARLGIRHCPVLVVDDRRLIPVDGLTEGELRTVLRAC